MKSPHSPLGPLALCALLAALGGGCTTSSTYEVKVHSIARASTSHHKLESYRIHTTHSALGPDSLRSKEAEQHIKTALSSQGMFEAPNPESADLIVEIDYGIEPARTNYQTVEVPIVGRVTEEPSSLERTTDERRGSRTAHTAQNAPRRLLGFESVVVPVVVREKHLSISGRENREWAEARRPIEIFRVTAKIEDESNDLRGRLPILASAVMDQIGRTTAGIATATVSERDEAVSFIKRGM
jgi:hypothetical protein